MNFFGGGSSKVVLFIRLFLIIIVWMKDLLLAFQTPKSVHARAALFVTLLSALLRLLFPKAAAAWAMGIHLLRAAAHAPATYELDDFTSETNSVNTHSFFYLPRQRKGQGCYALISFCI